MNIAFFLVPKVNVAFLYEDNTLRQGLEKMRFHGYTSIPVIANDGRYKGSISEGDFLWHIVDNEKNNLGKTKIKDILRIDRTPPVLITATMETLLMRAMDQNYVPVVDDRGTFMGIITRRDIIKYFYNESFLEKEVENYAYAN